MVRSKALVVAAISLAIIVLGMATVVVNAKPDNDRLNTKTVAGGNGAATGVGFQRMLRHLHMFPPGKGLGLGVGAALELSDELKEGVLAILKEDSNVSELLNEGYNVTAIIPLIKLVVQGDGSIALEVVKVWVNLHKEGEGVVHVLLDYEKGEVVKIWSWKTCECMTGYGR